jgi:hypothetical protein
MQDPYDYYDEKNKQRTRGCAYVLIVIVLFTIYTVCKLLFV